MGNPDLLTPNRGPETYCVGRPAGLRRVASDRNVADSLRACCAFLVTTECEFQDTEYPDGSGQGQTSVSTSKRVGSAQGWSCCVYDRWSGISLLVDNAQLCG
jgi:hypothetical protein